MSVFLLAFLFHIAAANIDWNTVAETTTFKASMATGYNYYEKFKKYTKTAENEEAQKCWSVLMDELPELCNRSKVLSTYLF